MKFIRICEIFYLTMQELIESIELQRRLHQISEGGWYNVSCNLPTRSQKEENESYQEIQVYLSSDI